MPASAHLFRAHFTGLLLVLSAACGTSAAAAQELQPLGDGVEATSSQVGESYVHQWLLDEPPPDLKRSLEALKAKSPRTARVERPSPEAQLADALDGLRLVAAVQSRDGAALASCAPTTSAVA